MVDRRTKWLVKGIDLIIEQGFQGFNIDELCGRMKIAKTSFYYYFISRELFLKELIIYWAEVLTPKVLKAIQLASNHRDLSAFIIHKSKSVKFYCFLIQANLYVSDKTSLASSIQQAELKLHGATDEFVSAILGQATLDEKSKTLIHTFLSGWDYLYGFKIIRKEQGADVAFQELENFLITFSKVGLSKRIAS